MHAPFSILFCESAVHDISTCLQKPDTTEDLISLAGANNLSSNLRYTQSGPYPRGSGQSTFRVCREKFLIAWDSNQHNLP